MARITGLGVLLVGFIGFLVMLVGVFLVRLLLGFQKSDLVLYVIGGTVGAAVEVIGTALGAWTYTVPTFLNIPLWLPFAWGITVVVAVRAAIPFLAPSKL